MRRVGIRFKFLANTFLDRKGPETARSSILGQYVSGNGEAHRSFKTFNVSNPDVEGGWLREPIMSSIQEEIVSALRSGERSKASNLLLELGSASQALQARDFICIFRHCAREPNPSFMMETWELMVEKDIEMSDACYYFAIQALCNGGYLAEAVNILSLQRENSKIYPTLAIYNTLLGACIRMGNLDLTAECLCLMIEQGVGKNLVTYGLLLKLAVLQNDISAVHNIWKECVNLQSPSIIILREFVRSFATLRDLESAYMVLQQMVALALQHKCNITITNEGEYSDSRLDIPIPFSNCSSLSGNGRNNFACLPLSSENYYVADSNMGAKFDMVSYEDGASRLCFSQQHFSRPVKSLLRQSFGDIIHACAHSQNVVLAKQLMLQMQNLCVLPSRSTYDGFIKLLVSVKNFHDGIKVLKIMQQKNMKPYDSSLAVISVSCSQALELDLAENFLDQMSSCRHAFTFNAFFEACNILDQPERAVRALAKMRNLNVVPDIRTYELMFSLFIKVNAPYKRGNVRSRATAAQRIQILEKDMMMRGIRHSPISLLNLLKALGEEGMIKQAMDYLQDAVNQYLDRIGIHFCNTLLHSLVEAKKSPLAFEMFKTVISSGLSPNAGTYTTMIDCCSRMQRYKSACALVSMMIRHGYPPSIHVYTSLIKILLKFKGFNAGLKLLNQAILEGIQPDLVLYNTILRYACKRGRIDVVELIVGQMHQMKIQPDTLSCTHVFLAYIRRGYFSTAMEALQVLCMRTISEQEDVLEEYRSKYEDVLFYDDLEAAESLIFEVFKDSEHVCLALLYLRWCAILGFPISWLPNKSPWAKRLSSVRFLTL